MTEEQKCRMSKLSYRAPTSIPAYFDQESRTHRLLASAIVFVRYLLVFLDPLPPT